MKRDRQKAHIKKGDMVIVIAGRALDLVLNLFDPSPDGFRAAAALDNRR